LSKKILMCFLVFCLLGSSALAESLTVGGTPVGISMKLEGVSVAGFSEVDGTVSPAESAGLKVGDIVVKIGGKSISTAKDFTDVVSELDGSEISVTVSRGGKLKQLNVTPALDNDGVWRLGVWLRDGIAGVGTLTFYDAESGVYGALGHSVSDSETGAVLPLREGSVYPAQIVDIVVGKSGTPGELCGVTDEAKALGDIQINCVCGIFGVADMNAGEVLETGDMTAGEAFIRCTLDSNGVKEYSVEIQKVEHCDSGTIAVVHITDPALIEKTGGIVQGMSGSPIIQNGRLVGAVTHVFVNDPTSGYGIGIYDMLSAAESMDKAA